MLGTERSAPMLEALLANAAGKQATRTRARGSFAHHFPAAGVPAPPIGELKQFTGHAPWSC